jgi:hypothetical protein
VINMSDSNIVGCSLCGTIGEHVFLEETRNYIVFECIACRMKFCAEKSRVSSERKV